MAKIVSMFMMFLTILALPYYLKRAKRLDREGNKEAIHQELKRYPTDYLKIRKKNTKRINVGNTVAEGPCIYLSNHQSHNDIFILLDTVPEAFRFIAKKELFESPMYGPFMKMSQSYPLDRDDPRQSLTLLKQSLNDAVEKNVSLVVFPEGTRSHKAEMSEFKLGLFSMMRKSKVPLVPVYIHESYNPKTKEYKAYFGEPIEPREFNTLKPQEICDRVRNTILSMQVIANES